MKKGNLLRQLRRFLGISQKCLAARWEIEPDTLRKWETAPEPPPVAIDALRFHMTEKKRIAEETPGAV